MTSDTFQQINDFEPDVVISFESQMEIDAQTIVSETVGSRSYDEVNYLAQRATNQNLKILTDSFNFPNAKWTNLKLLSEYGIPIPPSWFITKEGLELVGFDSPISIPATQLTEDTLQTLTQFQSRYFDQHSSPQYWLLKSLSEHFGLSILLTEPDKNLLYVPNDALLFQELILPDIGKEYIEDFRVIFVGGKPVDYYTRKAKDPIVTKEGILVSNQIKLSQVLSNMLFSGEGYSEVPDNVHTYLDMAQVSWDILLSERLPYGHGQSNQEIYSLLCGEPLIGSVDMLVGKVPKVIESHAMMQFDAVNLITPICEYLETISENKRVVLYGHHVLYDSLAGELLNNGFEVHFADRI